MIRAVYDAERGPRAESLAHAGDEAEVREVVASALQEEHGQGYRVQVLGASDGRPFRRVQRESEEREPSHPGEWRARLCARRHPSAHRLAPAISGRSGAHSAATATAARTV